MHIQTLRDTGHPFILVDHQARVLELNPAFTAAFGWGEELIGQSMRAILPPEMAMAHALCFARFRPSASRLLGHPLELPTLCRDGRQLICLHTIVAEVIDEQLLVAATITPQPATGDRDPDQHP
ncbi:MAG: hypothetical protein RLZZ219_690 [Cyanobacteriota bacterium]|jgi:PAS domain S-box-containing protein